MKIKKWHRKVASALLAAGIWIPATSYAFDIPLGDPSFELYPVPAAGYAYAAAPNGTYRPTSPWVDDLDSPPDNIAGAPGYIQDDHGSNWLYTATYAESPTYSRRASPRTGTQAMHGLARYSAQETTALFAANRTYKFSIWAQNDEILNEGNGYFVYIFDANVPFNDGSALAGGGGSAITAVNARQVGMTAAQSQANWTQLSVSLAVLPGAPEIGHPIGVAFFARKDSAVDDARLQSLVPEPTSVILAGLGGVTLLARRRRK